MEGAVFVIVTFVIIIVAVLVLSGTNTEKEEGIETLEQDRPDRQILEKLPHISNLVSWYDNNAYIRFCFGMINRSQELSADATKWLLQTLLREGLNTSSLVAVSSKLANLYEPWCRLLNFLAKKGFITIKKYKFPAVYDEFDLLLKPASDYLVIDITDLGKIYVEEEDDE